MAASAIGTKFIVVNIIWAMATAATSTNGLHLVESTSMAVITGDADVSAAQLEVGLQIVVEGP